MSSITSLQPWTTRTDHANTNKHSVGDKYPNSTITGIDLSPIQPNYVPENVHFFVDDFEEEWLDPENKYDFIHIRHTLHSVQDLDTLLQRALRYAPPLPLSPQPTPPHPIQHPASSTHPY